MRKLTRKSLEELAQKMPVLSEKVQSSFIGGGTGTRENPFTFGEYKDLGSLFTEGWVDLPDSISLLKHPYDYYFGDSGYDMLSFLGGSGYDGASGYWGGSGYDGASGYGSGSDSGENNSDGTIECKPSCLFYALNHLDGDDDYDMCDYSRDYINSGGSVGPKGQVPIAHLHRVANLAGLKLTYIRDSSTMSKDGTVNGCRVMLIIPGEDPVEENLYHAVVLTGYKIENGQRILTYYDPNPNAKKKTGEIPRLDCYLYAVSRLETVVEPSGQ